MDKDKIILIKEFMNIMNTKYLKDIPLPSFGNPTNKHNLKHLCKVIDLIPELSYKGNLLDIGLGSGRYLFSIAQVKNYNLYSIEHPKMNELLKHKYFSDLIPKFNIHLKRVDIINGKLPFKDDFFDVVMFNHVIEHMTTRDTLPILREIRRVLKKDGLLILETPNLFSLIHRIKAVFGIDFGYDLGDAYIKKRGYPSHIREYSANELKTILTNCGFRIEKLIMSHLQYGKPIIDTIVNIPNFFLPSVRNIIVLIAKKN